MSSQSQEARSKRLVMGIAGRIGSGKTSAAKYLSSRHGFQYLRDRVDAGSRERIVLDAAGQTGSDRVLENVPGDTQRRLVGPQRALESVPLPQAFSEFRSIVKSGVLLSERDESSAVRVLSLALDKKMDRAADESLQISQLMMLVKGQAEKTHAALRTINEGNRSVIQAIETQLKRDQTDLARRAREEALECNNRGVALYYRGALEAALEAFRQAIHLLPEYAEAHNNLGLVLSRMGKESEAEQAFQEALRLDPAMSEVYNNLGFLYHTSSHYDRAVEMFGQAIQSSSDSSVAYANLGNSLYKMKQAEKAVGAWRRALELDPMNETARRSLRMFQQDSSNN